MTLGEFVDRVADNSRTITVFAPEPDETLAAYFAARDVTVEHELLPDDGSGGFVTVESDGEFVGSAPRAAVRELLVPDVRDLDTGPNEAVRLPMNLLADTTFVSFDRQQMLATSREVEDRAFRRGRGTLRAGFQSLSTLKREQETYDLLAEQTDLDVHVYGRPDWNGEFPQATVHAENDDEIGRFWFVVFDGGGNDQQTCALLAEEVEGDPGSFRGFWTYDPALVADLDAYLAETYG